MTKNLLKSVMTIALSLMLSFLAISSDIPVTNGAVTAYAATKNSVKLNKSKVNLKVGEKCTLKLTGTTKKVTWSVSDGKIVSVTQKGVVKAKKDGTAYVYATAAGKTYMCKIKVSKKESSRKDTVTHDISMNQTDSSTKDIVTNDESTNQTDFNAVVDNAVGSTTNDVVPPEFSLNYSTYEGIIATSFRLELQNNVDNANVTYSSSNPNAVAVSSEGLVKLMYAGDATIYVRVNDEVLECQVTVNHPDTSTWSEKEIAFMTGTNGYFDAFREIAKEDYNDREIVKAVHDWVIQHTEYGGLDGDYEMYDAYSLPGVFLNHFAVCQGYQYAMSLLLFQFCITNMNIYSDYHAWNLVLLDEIWYHVDACWDDMGDYSRYDFFLVEDSVMETYHKFNHDLFPPANGEKYDPNWTEKMPPIPEDIDINTIDVSTCPKVSNQKELEELVETAFEEGEGCAALAIVLDDGFKKEDVDIDELVMIVFRYSRDRGFKYSTTCYGFFSKYYNGKTVTVLDWSGHMG